MPSLQIVTLMGMKACFYGASSMVWCHKPPPRLVNRPFAPTLNHLMGHKTLRLVVPNQKVSDDG